MMEQTHRKARSRYFPADLREQGFGIFIMEPKDFPRTERDTIAAAIVEAYDAGRLPADLLATARAVACAMQAPCPTLEALRWFLRADGRQMVALINQVAGVVPPLTNLTCWIAL